MGTNAEESAPALTEGVSVWLTTRQAAEYVGYSWQHLHRLRYEGGGPTWAQHGPGARIRYRRSDLDAWLATGPREAGSARKGRSK